MRKGIAVDPDLNKYDLNHVTTAHPRMSGKEWEDIYQSAWNLYYTKEHVETVLRRLVAMRGRATNAILLMTWFKGSIQIEGVHPLEAGLLRYKFRHDRRPGMPRVPAWRFYPRYVIETAGKLRRWLSTYLELRKIYVRIKKDPRRLEYMDLALTPVTDAELDTLELFHHTEAAETFMARERAAAG
jgi:hypothetical protein